MTSMETRKAMSIFERYLTVWVALCIVSGRADRSTRNADAGEDLPEAPGVVR